MSQSAMSLGDSLETLALAEELAGVGHWQYSIETASIVWSEGMYRIYGTSREAFQPTFEAVLEAYHPDDRAELLRHAQTARAGLPFQSKLRLRRLSDGCERIVTANAAVRKDEEGRPKTLVGVLRDVTELELATRQLHESEQRFRLLTANATDIVSESDVSGRFRYVSPSVSTVTGYAADEVVGKFAIDFVHPDDRDHVEQQFGIALRSPGITQIEHRHIRKDGKVIWMQTRPRLARDPVTNKPISITDVMRDVTAQKALEADLIAARSAADEAAQVKSDFLSNMSHELRTPLTSILGFSRLLQSDAGLTEQGLQWVRRVNTASAALLTIVNDILDFSKLESGQVEIEPRPTRPCEVFADALDMFEPQAAEKSLAVTFDWSGERDVEIIADDGRLRQVLINLIGNAIKFTAAGEVSLLGRYDQDKGCLRCEVQDTGIGIPTDRLDRLFQRFSQVDASTARVSGGTGLGLAICKGLVEAMGGQIGARSVPGTGSVFWFEIPCEVSVALNDGRQEPSVIDGSNDLTGLRLLVVDDHRANREIVRLLLTPLGVVIEEAASGAEALSIANETPFDVILLDMRMPVMSGSEVASALRGTGHQAAETPIIAFTADSADVARSYSGHLFDDYVAKPLSLDCLTATLAKWWRAERIGSAEKIKQQSSL